MRSSFSSLYNPGGFANTPLFRASVPGVSPDMEIYGDAVFHRGQEGGVNFSDCEMAF